MVKSRTACVACLVTTSNQTREILRGTRILGFPTLVYVLDCLIRG